MLSSLRTTIFLSLCLLLTVQYLTFANALSRGDFPDDFVFGTASAAYQYEGAAREGGRGPSIWDTFSLVKGNVLGNANGNVAVDQYHRYKEDIGLMADMGTNAYRFSISWTRIYPVGKGSVNEEGVAYYNNIINGLLEKGIQPFATIYHWDLPQALQNAYGGWLSPLIVDDFATFVDTCFSRFGDRVKHWITINEPTSFILFGYNSGLFPPQRCSPWMGNCTAGDSMTEPYIVAHNVLLGHARAVNIYRTKYQKHQKGVIGLTAVVNWYIPLTKSAANSDAVERLIDFTFGWYLEPMLYGHYPASMRRILGNRLPSFTEDQQRMLRHSLDFLGLNYYTTYYVEDIKSYANPQHSDFYQDSMTNTTGERNGVPIGPQAASAWLYIYPRGIYDLLTYIKRKYKDVPPIYITENGVDEANNASLSLKESLHDPVRIKALHDHLSYLAKAIKAGVDVRGYFAWSLLDNFEWTWGYTVRFGLHFVDFNNLNRYAKDSALWFKKFLKT